MDTRLLCIEVMRFVERNHPCKVPTHKIYSELNIDRRSCQRQIKFLVECGYLQRFPDYKVGLK